MPAKTDSNRPDRPLRWMASAIKTSEQRLPALPFDRANRGRPASLAPTATVRTAAAAAH